MPKEASFDNLIQAIQQAFISVNDMSEEQHIAKLREYFDEEGMPRTFEMHIRILMRMDIRRIG